MSDKNRVKEKQTLFFCLQAVCCADGIHCCPQGTQCRDGACFNVIPVLRKTVARAVGAGGGVHEVICPGGKESCPSGDTCCKLEFEQWGCCPIARVSVAPGGRVVIISECIFYLKIYKKNYFKIYFNFFF